MALINNIDLSWVRINNLIQNILVDNKVFNKYNISELYNYTLNMVQYIQNEDTYKELDDLIVEHLENNVRAKFVNISSDDLLHVLCNIWDGFQSSIHSLCYILPKLSHHAFTNDQTKKIIIKMSKGLFSQLIVYYGDILNTIRAQLFRLLNDDRDGKTVNREEIKQILTIMMSLEPVLDGPTPVNETNTVYDIEFKSTIIDEYSTFIEAEGKKLIQSSAHAIAYINSAESLIAREEVRIKHYFDKKTQIQLKSIMNINLVQLHMDAIVEMKNNDMKYMIENKEYEHLTHMYNFLNRVDNGVNPMIKYLHSYVFELGESIVLDTSKNGTDFIQSLIDLNITCNYLLINCFNNDLKLKCAFTESFEFVVALNPMADKYLSVFVIDKLKTIVRSVETTSQEHEVVLEAMKIYGFLYDKDPFEESLKHFIATMLFNKFLKNSVLNNTTMHMLSILKVNCSHEFTSKVNNMIKIVDTHSKTAMDEFKQHVVQSKNHLLTSVDHFNALVLTKAYWPTFESISCKLPLELSSVYDNFKEFYKKKNNRHLTLLPKYGLIDLKAVFYSSSQSNDKSLASVSPKEYTIQVSTLQTCVLLLFNNCDQLTLETIIRETNIPKKILIKILMSLILTSPSQCNILMKNPLRTKFELTDKFCINEAFTSDSRIVKMYSQKTKLNSVVRKEINNGNMNQNADMLIKLSIVRIMKLKRKMTHAALIEEIEKVNSELKPTTSIIKKQIDRLIERKYIAKSTEDPSVYMYIA